LGGNVLTADQIGGFASLNPPYSTFSAIWFFTTLLPVLNIIPINNIMAERYLYIPGIGFTMLFGSILTHSISGHGVYKLFRI